MSDEPEKPNWRAKPLDYERPENQLPGSTLVRHAFIACILVGVLVVASVLVVILSFIVAPLFGFAILSGALFAIGATLRYAIQNGSDPDKKGWVIGIWMGFGLGMLFEGICFGNAMHF